MCLIYWHAVFVLLLLLTYLGWDLDRSPWWRIPMIWVRVASRRNRTKHHTHILGREIKYIQDHVFSLRFVCANVNAYFIITWAPLSPGSRYFVATEMFIDGLFDVIVILRGKTIVIILIKSGDSYYSGDDLNSSNSYFLGWLLTAAQKIHDAENWVHLVIEVGVVDIGEGGGE